MVVANLMESDPICFYELVMKARNPEHQFFGKTGEKLFEMKLLEDDGRVNKDIAHLIKVAVKGE
jgi:hypothetical protein